MLSAASCTLDRHLVIVDTWQTGQDVISPQLTPDTTVYYAHGTGWTAFLAEQGTTAATSTLQMQLTNDAGGLLAQSTSGNPPAPRSGCHTAGVSPTHRDDARRQRRHVLRAKRNGPPPDLTGGRAVRFASRLRVRRALPVRMRHTVRGWRGRDLRR